MKKYLMPIALVAAASMTFSCSKSENASTALEGEHVYVFNVNRESLSADDETKAVFSTDSPMTVKFESGDKAGVIVVDENSSATGNYGTINADDQTTQIYVSSSIASGSTVYFYYPYASKQTAYAACPLNIPTYQTSDSEDFDADAMPLVAKPVSIDEELTASEYKDVSYYNLGSVVKFMIYDGNSAYAEESVKSISFTASGNIAGDFTYDLSSVDGETFSDITASEATVESAFNELVSLDGKTSKTSPVTIYMVVAPGKYTGTFKVTTDKAVYEWELTTEKTFQRSKKKNAYLNLATATRTAQELADYKTVTELPYTNALTSDDGYFKIENQSNESNLDAIWTFTSSYGAKATAYVNKTNYAAESYLVSPIFDIDGVSNIKLTFEHAGRYFATPLSTYAKLLVRTVGDDGTYGDWTELTIDNYFGNTSWTYVTATVDLSDYASGAFQLAFDYSSTTSAAGTWEIKNFSIAEFDPEPVIESVDPETITFASDDAAGTEYTVKVNAKYATAVDATIDDEENFSVSVSDLTDGVATITVKNLNEAAEKKRTATISVTATDGTNTSDATTVSVVQEGTAVASSYTLTFSSTTNGKSIGSYTATWTATCNDFTWNLANFNNNSNKWEYVKCGSKNFASVATITTASAIPIAISTVTVTIDAITTSSVNSTTLYVDTTSDFSSSACQTVTFTAAKGENAITVPTPTANCYYKLEFDCAQASSNGIIQISKVVYE